MIDVYLVKFRSSKGKLRFWRESLSREDAYALKQAMTRRGLLAKVIHRKVDPFSFLRTPNASEIPLARRV